MADFKKMNWLSYQQLEKELKKRNEKQRCLCKIGKKTGKKQRNYRIVEEVDKSV